MNTASVIKIPVMVLAFRDADAGTLDLNERYTTRAEDIRGGTGLLRTFAPGVQPTTLDLITQMIITSDNTATDIMIAKVGLARVNRLLDSLGYRETRLRTTVGEVLRAPQSYRPALADTSAAARSMAFVLDSAQWLGRTTARETLLQHFRSAVAEAVEAAEAELPDHAWAEFDAALIGAEEDLRRSRALEMSEEELIAAANVAQQQYRRGRGARK